MCISLHLCVFDGCSGLPSVCSFAMLWQKCGFARGAVEGSIKQNVNLRLKRSGARWKAEHVGPLVELRALSHEPEWQNLWTAV